MNYRIFNLQIASDLPLPVLPEADGGQVAFEVRLARGAIDAGFEFFHEWTSPQGQVVSACARRGEDYLLRFPGLCDFELQLADRRIRVRPVDDADRDTAAHLLVDQVIPRVLGHRGRVVTHASGVVLEGGPAVAFLGESGFGKSTLASGFYRSGAALLADDCLALRVEDGRLFGQPPYPSFRVWQDTAEHVFGLSGDFRRFVPYTTKLQMLPDDARRVITGPAPMAALFLLGDPAANAEHGEVRIRPARGMTAARAMLEAAFVLDVQDRAAIARSFEAAMQVLQCGVPVFHLDYPREYGLLEQVRASIVGAIAA